MQFKKNNFYEGTDLKTVLGGELHYFRLPMNEWENRILAMKDAGFTLISSYVPWMIHENVEGEIDLLGNTYENCNLLYFLQLIARHGMQLLLRPGPYVMSELVGSGIPAWLLHDYPEVRAIGSDGNIHNVPELVCILHPTYLEKVEKWIVRLSELIKPFMAPSGPIMMLQLDNEVGMFPWVTNNPDLHPVIVDKFENYAKVHGIIDLCETSDYSEKRKMIMNPQSKQQRRLLHLYKKFEREYIKEYLVILQQLFRKNQINVMNCVNVHGFTQQDYAKRGTKYPIGLSQLSECATMENTVLAGDYYVGNLVYENMGDLLIVNAMTKSVQNPEQPLFSAEFQSGFQNSIPKLLPSTHDLKARLCFAQGMNAINYYMFCGGFNYRDTGLISYHHDWQAPIGNDGSLRKSYYLLKRWNEVIHANNERYLMSDVDHQIHVLYSLDDYLTPYTNSCSNSVTYIENQINNIVFEGIGKYCTYKNIAIEAINLNGTRIIKAKRAILMSTRYMDIDAQQKIVDYLKQGNHLFIYGAIPEMDYDENPCTIILDYLNIQAIEVEAYTQVSILDEPSIQTYGNLAYKGANLHALGSNKQGNCIAFEMEHAQSKIVVLSTSIDMGFNYTQAVFEKLLARIEISSSFEVNEKIQVSSRRYQNSKFIHVMNVFDEDVHTQIIENGSSLFDGKTICVPARSAKLLPIHFIVKDTELLEFATQEVCKVEELADAWQLTFNMRDKKLVYKVINETIVSVEVETEMYTIVINKVK